MSGTMTNDDLSLKMAKLEGMFNGMASSLQRIEQAVEKVVSMDRSLAELVVKSENESVRIRELEHAVKNCQNTQRLAGEVVDRRINEMHRESQQFVARTEGVLVVLKVFSGFAMTVVLAIAGWAYSRIETSTALNVQHAQHINMLERDVNNLVEAARRDGK